MASVHASGQRAIFASGFGFVPNIFVSFKIFGVTILGKTSLGKSVGGGSSFFDLGFVFAGGMDLNLTLESNCPKAFDVILNI